MIPQFSDDMTDKERLEAGIQLLMSVLDDCDNPTDVAEALRWHLDVEAQFMRKALLEDLTDACPDTRDAPNWLQTWMRAQFASHEEEQMNAQSTARTFALRP